jgi:DNA-binding NarL/FixJ family response regulator
MYVVKTAADAELLTAIRAVFQGRIFVSFRPGERQASVAPRGRAEGGAARTAGVAALSSRERGVFVLLAPGHTNQAIADRLFLSVKTAETCRACIADKPGLRTLAELVRHAVEMGLLCSETAGRASDREWD